MMQNLKEVRTLKIFVTPQPKKKCDENNNNSSESNIFNPAHFWSSQKITLMPSISNV